MPKGDLTRWLARLADLIRGGGSLTLIHVPEALEEVLVACSGRFGGLRVLPVYARAGEPAIRILVQGRKGSRAPLKLLSGLVLHTADQSFTPQVEAILREGASLNVGG